MAAPVPDDLATFLARTAPTPTDLQVDMADHGRETGFPIIGPVAGGVCLVVARLVGARTVFEFGSGFGYSASWFARAIPPDRRIVLTDHDPANLERARGFLERADVADRAVFAPGDALETVETYPGPFDVVLLDHEKRRYEDGFTAVRDKVARGGAVIADNILAGAVSFAEVRDHVSGEARPDGSAAAGIARYLERVRADPAFDTVVLPVDEGLAVSVRHREDPG